MADPQQVVWDEPKIEWDGDHADALARVSKPTKFEQENSSVGRNFARGVGESIHHIGENLEHMNPLEAGMSMVGAGGQTDIQPPAPGKEFKWSDVHPSVRNVGRSLVDDIAPGKDLSEKGANAATLPLTGLMAGRDIPIQGRFPHYAPPEQVPFNLSRATTRAAAGAGLDLLSPTPSGSKAATGAAIGLATEVLPWAVTKAARSKPVVDFLTRKGGPRTPPPLESEVQAWRDNTEPIKGGGPFDNKATPTEPPASKPVGEARVETMAKSPEKPVVDKGVDMSRRNFLKKGGQAVVGGAASGAFKLPEGVSGVSAADAGEAMKLGQSIGAIKHEIKSIDLDDYESGNIDLGVLGNMFDKVYELADKAKTPTELKVADRLLQSIYDKSGMTDYVPYSEGGTVGFINKLKEAHPELSDHISSAVSDAMSGDYGWSPEQEAADNEYNSPENWMKREAEEQAKQAVKRSEQLIQEKVEKTKNLAQEATETRAAQGPGRRTTDFNIGGLGDPFAPTSAAQSPEFNFARPSKGPKPLLISDTAKDAFQRFVKSKGKEGPLAPKQPPKPKGISRRPDMQDDQAVKQEIESRTQVRPKEPGRKGKAELAEEFKRGKRMDINVDVASKSLTDRLKELPDLWADEGVDADSMLRPADPRLLAEIEQFKKETGRKTAPIKEFNKWRDKKK